MKTFFTFFVFAFSENPTIKNVGNVNALKRFRDD